MPQVPDTASDVPPTFAPSNDLGRQYRDLRGDLDAAVGRVSASGFSSRGLRAGPYDADDYISDTTSSWWRSMLEMGKG